MPRPSTDACRRLKTAIAEESGNIQGMAERFIAESHGYVKQRIPQGTFDPSLGENPRSVRYSTAPIPDTPYIDLLVQGHETESQRTRGCDGQYSDISATVDRRGAMGCNLPGQGIEGGYDEFTRVLKGKAWETKPWCAFDLLLKNHAGAFVSMLRNDLPRRAMEQFEYSLERNVIDLGRYNTSAVNGFVTAAGEFPAVPEGMLDVGTVRRLAAILRVQGWTGPMELTISAEAFEYMRLNYKQNYGLELQSTVESNETHFLGEDVTVLNWAGIRWVITDRPTRGYLRPDGSGGYTFVPVRPTRARAGTGEGIVVDVNEDYFSGFTYCDGVRYPIYEASFFVHPKAATREAFAMPSMNGQSWSSNLFNFEVRLIDGAYLDCNKDNFKGQFRLLHAYAFDSTNPELMGAILHAVAPDQIFVNGLPDQYEPAPGAPVVPLQPGPLELDACSQSDRNLTDENCVDPLVHLLPEPTETDPFPDNVVGQLRFLSPGTYQTTQGQTVRVSVERIGGTEGAASVTLTPTEGTATDPEDYETPGATVLNWADGEAGRKHVDIPITEDATFDTQFTVARSSATGATWTGDTSVTVSIEDFS